MTFLFHKATPSLSEVLMSIHVNEYDIDQIWSICKDPEVLNKYVTATRYESADNLLDAQLTANDISKLKLSVEGREYLRAKGMIPSIKSLSDGQKYRLIELINSDGSSSVPRISNFSYDELFVLADLKAIHFDYENIHYGKTSSRPKPVSICVPRNGIKGEDLQRLLI